MLGRRRLLPAARWPQPPTRPVGPSSCSLLPPKRPNLQTASHRPLPCLRAAPRPAPPHRPGSRPALASTGAGRSGRMAAACAPQRTCASSWSGSWGRMGPAWRVRAGRRAGGRAGMLFLDVAGRPGCDGAWRGDLPWRRGSLCGVTLGEPQEGVRQGGPAHRPACHPWAMQGPACSPGADSISANQRPETVCSPRRPQARAAREAGAAGRGGAGAGAGARSRWWGQRQRRRREGRRRRRRQRGPQAQAGGVQRLEGSGPAAHGADDR